MAVDTELKKLVLALAILTSPFSMFLFLPSPHSNIPKPEASSGL